MGDRISFREGGEGLAQKTSATGAVSILEPRVRFRKGYLTGTTPVAGAVECGDGTIFSVLVTPEQLHEICYRVADAYFTSGEMSFTFGGGVTISAQNQPVPASINPIVWTHLVEAESLASGSVFAERGYVYGYEIGDDDLAPEKDHVLDTEYDFTGVPYGTGSVEMAYRDYLIDRPLGMWSAIPEFTKLSSLGGFTGLGFLEAEDRQWGFRQYFASESTGDNATIYGIWAGTDDTYEMYCGLVSSLEVAYYDAEDPYDPDAILYLNVVFELVNPDIGFSTVNYPGTSAHGNLILELSNSQTVSCPIYAAGTSGAAVDWVCKAFRWWPYETTAAVAAFDQDTGLPANGGPGA